MQKLLEAKADGATDVNACLLANISVRTYYKYCEHNEEFVQMMERAGDLKEVMANRTLRRALESTDWETGSLKERVALAWEIVKDGQGREERRFKRELEKISYESPMLPGGARMRLTTAQPVPGNATQINVQVGPGYQPPERIIRAEDLTDAQCERLARGEDIVSVLGEGVQLAHKPSDK
ncbi:hypothetical protein KW797_03985 [Candidatus Parcubacteria bacterium]|nr:hypothetical protein [Candidatus Parcubacteria bacterium]